MRKRLLQAALKKLQKKTKRAIQGVNANLGASEEMTDAAVTAVLSELDGMIFTLKEEQRIPRKAVLGGHVFRFTLVTCVRLYSGELTKLWLWTGFCQCNSAMQPATGRWHPSH